MSNGGLGSVSGGYVTTGVACLRFAASAGCVCCGGCFILALFALSPRGAKIPQSAVSLALNFRYHSMRPV